MNNTHVERRGECLCEEERRLPPPTLPPNRTIRRKTGFVPVYLYEWKSEDVYMWGVSAYVFNLLRWHLRTRAQRCSPAYATAEDLADAFRDEHQIVDSCESRWESHVEIVSDTFFFDFFRMWGAPDPPAACGCAQEILRFSTRVGLASREMSQKLLQRDVSSVIALNFLGPCVQQHTPTRTVPL